MKLLTREFTRNEKILLAVLAIIILALCYYKFIYTPIKDQTSEANAEADDLLIEVTVADAKLEEMRSMQAELDGIEADGTGSYMASYNNEKAELEFLNDVLMASTSYDISISSVTRTGNQVRRNISMVFTVADYTQAEQIIRDLEGCEFRCLVSDVSVSGYGSDLTAAQDSITVTATATFYETMVGGTADAGLPEETVDETVDADADVTEY